MTGTYAAQIGLQIPAEDLHPIHRFVCEAPGIGRGTVLERDPTGEVTAPLLHVAGDRRRYGRAVGEVPRVEAWTTTAAAEGAYVDVRTRLRDRERRDREAPDRDAVLAVPPVGLRSDRTVRQTLVGRSDALSAAVESLPSEVNRRVFRTGTYDRRARRAPVTRAVQSAASSS